MKRRGGFTLVEMMVVIIIIIIMASVSVALLNTFFKGQGARQGGMIVMQAVARAKQAAAETHNVHFLVFSTIKKEGWLEVHRDADGDGRYTGDQDPATQEPDTGDPMLEGHRIDLPKYVVFEVAPDWIAFQPSGHMTLYRAGSPYNDVPAGQFDGVMDKLASASNRIGDVIVWVENQDYWMCLDVDRPSGKVRRQVFVTAEK